MNAHTGPQIAPEQGKQTVIDTKFPLSWLIGCSATIVFAFGAFSFQVNSLTTAVGKIEAKSDARDDKATLLQQMVLIQQGKIDTQNANISRNSADIIDLKRDISEMQRKQTWAPK